LRRALLGDRRDSPRLAAERLDRDVLGQDSVCLVEALLIDPETSRLISSAISWRSASSRSWAGDGAALTRLLVKLVEHHGDRHGAPPPGSR
jgi:hypothetical protein